MQLDVAPHVGGIDFDRHVVEPGQVAHGNVRPRFDIWTGLGSVAHHRQIGSRTRSLGNPWRPANVSTALFRRRPEGTARGPNPTGGRGGPAGTGHLPRPGTAGPHATKESVTGYLFYVVRSLPVTEGGSLMRNVSRAVVTLAIAVVCTVLSATVAVAAPSAAAPCAASAAACVDLSSKQAGVF